MEGCAEHALLRSDRTVDALAASIWRGLPQADRSAFARGEGSWLDYRRASCEAEVARDAGGSIQAVLFPQCETARNRTHQLDLTRLLHGLTHP